MRTIDDLDEKTLRAMVKALYHMIDSARHSLSLGNKETSVLTVPLLLYNNVPDDWKLPEVYVWEPTDSLIVIMSSDKEALRPIPASAGEVSA